MTVRPTTSVPERADPPGWPHVFESLFFSAPSAMGLLDCDLHFVAVNDAYCRLFGLESDDLVGELLFDMFPDRLGSGAPEKVRQSLETVFRSGDLDVLSFLRYDIESSTRPGTFEERYWSVTNFPVRSTSDRIEFVVIHPVEVTTFVAERLRAEVSGQQLRSAELTAALDTVFGAEIERLHAIGNLAEGLGDAATIDAVARIVVREGLEVAGADAGAFVVLAGDRFRIMAHNDIDGSTIDAWSEFTVLAGNEPFSDALLSGEQLFFGSRDEFLGAYPHLRATVEAEQHHAWAVLPLMNGSRAIGAIGVIFNEPRANTTVVRTQLLALRDLAWQSASRAMLAEEQTAAITSVQRLLDIRIEDHPSISVSTLYRPAAQMLSAGGDFFDVIATADDRIVFVIADVADHGASTAGEMVRARATLQNNVVAVARPRDVATATAATLERFAMRHTTACIVSYDATHSTLTWTSAGHPYPLLRKRDGDVLTLAETHGPPLGIAYSATDYGESSCDVSPGDTLVLYTDGLIERRDESITNSIERLVSVLRSLGPGDVCEALYRDLLPAGVHDDDVAILAVTIVDREQEMPGSALALDPVLSATSSAAPRSANDQD